MTQNRMLTMSTKEIERSEILKMVEEKKITQKAGARKIAVSERQFRSRYIVRAVQVEIY